MNFNTLAEQISKYLKIDIGSVSSRLSAGFHENHRLVAEDFTKNNTDVNNPDSLLNWYRNTDAYIWELSAYHLDERFNYSGMCEGIFMGFKNSNRNKVLSLGDGIGTLSLRMAEGGLDTTYHDLKDGKTCGFALSRFEDSGLPIKTLFTDNWDPKLGSSVFDGIVALDFFEHLVNVEDWAKAVFKALKKNGAFIAQNAFAIGDAEHGNSIPMHLSVNNKYETEWIPLMQSIGFIVDPASGWLIKP